jgi:hypothetical protein
VSGAITVGSAERLAPTVQVLLEPARYAPRVSRLIFHEAIHFWQHVGSGYLAAIAAEEWARLKAFERQGQSAAPGPRRVAFVSRVSQSGFSARDLHEALARFWDVHVIGPALLLELEFADPARQFPGEFVAEYWRLKREGKIVHPVTRGYSGIAYQMAMQAAAGNYAAPYIRTVDRLGWAGDVVFPLAGYFAFQTDNPVDAFTILVDKVGPRLQPKEPGEAIHDLWRAAFRHVATAALLLAREKGTTLQHIGSEAYDHGGLADHDVWAAMARLRPPAAQVWRGKPPYPMDDAPNDEDLRAMSTLEYVLACPGDPDYREGLVAGLTPPLILFEDGPPWPLGVVASRQAANRNLAPVMNALAGACASLHERWERFRAAARGY